MTRTLYENISLLATFDDDDRELRDAAILVEDHLIAAIGPADSLRAQYRPDRSVDLSDHVVLPGFVNTHHHFYQSFTRAMAQNAGTFEFLRALYPVWSRLDDDALYVGTRLSMAELLLSGCTTTADHHYVFPDGVTMDSQMEAAASMQMRFHACRGAMSLGQSDGGLPPDACVEAEEDILKDSERVIDRYHDASPHAMTRVALAPCSPFSVTGGLMKEVAELARQKGVRLHSHIAQDADEDAFSLEKYGKRSIDFAESVGWLGPDVWFAHCIYLTDDELNRFAASGTGVSYCPTANSRVAAGIARIGEMLSRNMGVSYGVDGAASSDAGNMVSEIRHGLLSQRIAAVKPATHNAPTGTVAPGSAAALSARQALYMATRGGAAVLGRDDIGQLAEGKCADFIAVDTRQIQFAGAQWDPIGAIAFCGMPRADQVVVNGRQLVKDGRLVHVEEAQLVAEHRAVMKRLYDMPPG